ncbi:hypothetical protein JMJ35_003611 [Cladonia borealis]|uniref:Uncharacterized protein n=1 Tax=Cladonia borealis TaxID=184061 RepID=A0AA39R596_9LECA|nr:hypothetical protein JMJ35_003611 [Cladonia borealis]
MRSSALVTSVIACLATCTVAQDFQSTCTYTTTECAPFNPGPTETITVYEVPFTATSTSTFDCQGCNYVSISSKNCDGVGLPITTTTFVIEPEATTTVNVCSTTPATAPSGGLPPRRFGRHR